MLSSSEDPEGDWSGEGPGAEVTQKWAYQKREAGQQVQTEKPLRLDAKEGLNSCYPDGNGGQMTPCWSLSPIRPQKAGVQSFSGKRGRGRYLIVLPIGSQEKVDHVS